MQETPHFAMQYWKFRMTALQYCTNLCICRLKNITLNIGGLYFFTSKNTKAWEKLRQKILEASFCLFRHDCVHTLRNREEASLNWIINNSSWQVIKLEVVLCSSIKAQRWSEKRVFLEKITIPAPQYVYCLWSEIEGEQLMNKPEKVYALSVHSIKVYKTKYDCMFLE